MVARYRNDFSSPLEIVSNVSASSPDRYVDVGGDSDWDLADLNAGGQTLNHTVLKTNLTQF